MRNRILTGDPDLVYDLELAKFSKKRKPVSNGLPAGMCFWYKDVKVIQSPERKKQIEESNKQNKGES